VGQIAFKSNTLARMTTTKQYDYLNRLTSISSTPSNAFSYLYNAANQRTMAWNWDSSYWRYNYDSLGQVTQGNKYWVDQTIVAGQQFNYSFDNIGNRTQTQIGGDQNGANLRLANYTNNNLNQITSRGVPAFVDLMGDGLATNGVTVNGSNAYRKNEYFRQQLPVTNTSAVWDGITVSATNQGSITGHMYVAQNPENYTYDADGNLLSDGRWNYTWDAENRLLSMTSLSGAPSGSLLQLTFAYDYMGRRIQKAVSTNTGGGSFSAYTNKFAYDGWNIVATMNPSFTLSNTFMWGTDLSGNVRGAGGVGGLLKVAYYGAATTNAFVGYDGNGNVSVLVSAANATTVANYEYGPFGEIIRQSGSMAKLNPCRFSTKFDDDESDFLYYGYRYYNPSTGKWAGRDPAGELQGGPNLYGFDSNDSLNHIDYIGQYEIDFHFFVIYYLLRAKCWSASSAYAIAHASQAVDDDENTKPTTLGMNEWWNLFLGNYAAAAADAKKLAQLHFINSTPTTSTRSGDLTAIANATFQLNTGNMTAAGIGLHVLADTWAHDGFTAYQNQKLNGQASHPDLTEHLGLPPVYIGHFNFAHDPDYPYLRPQRALSAALAIYSIIPSQCSCTGGPISLSTLTSDLQRQFSESGSEYQRSIAAWAMIELRFGDSVWDNDHNY
jgi:RHS repeat-associated protein